MNIFYAWQSDTPDSVGKGFVREALIVALMKTGEELGLEEAERPVLDQDTKGVMGSPVIAETIFAKIREASVVVVDVTLTGNTADGKCLINSNVAYELGFAHGHHGDQVLLKVMNTHYGPPDDLPFDLRHRRWPVQFNLSPDASKSERRVVRERLVSELTEILKQYLETKKPVSTLFIPTPSTMNAATYWNHGDALVHTEKRDDVGNEIVLVYEPTQPLIYLRLWPSKPIDTLPPEILNEYRYSSIEPLGGRTRGYSHDRNRFGVITYAAGDSEIFSSTQVLKSGEIWGINAYLLRRIDGYDFPFVPTGAFESGIAQSLDKYINSAVDHFGYRDEIFVECGLVNIGKFRLALPERFVNKFSDRIYDDVIVQTVVVLNERDESKKQALAKMFTAVYEAAGMIRPA